MLQQLSRRSIKDMGEPSLYTGSMVGSVSTLLLHWLAITQAGVELLWPTNGARRCSSHWDEGMLHEFLRWLSNCMGGPSLRLMVNFWHQWMVTSGVNIATSKGTKILCISSQGDHQKVWRNLTSFCFNGRVWFITLWTWTCGELASDTKEWWMEVYQGTKICCTSSLGDLVKEYEYPYFTLIQRLSLGVQAVHGLAITTALRLVVNVTHGWCQEV